MNVLVSIEVTPRLYDGETSFHELRLFHGQCASNELVKYRNPATSDYSLRCTCGLEIQLPANSAAIRMIIGTAIDEKPRLLDKGTIVMNRGDAIEVRYRSTA